MTTNSLRYLLECNSFGEIKIVIVFLMFVWLKNYTIERERDSLSISIKDS